MGRHAGEPGVGEAIGTYFTHAPAAQQVERPDWRIDVQEVVELGDSVVIRAHAHGTVPEGRTSVLAAVDWLAHYRFHGGKIIEINLLSVVAGARD